MPPKAKVVLRRCTSKSSKIIVIRYQCTYRRHPRAGEVINVRILVYIDMSHSVPVLMGYHIMLIECVCLLFLNGHVIAFPREN